MAAAVEQQQQQQGGGKPPMPPKPIKEGRGPWFVLGAAATVAALTLLCLAEAGQNWLHAWVDGDTDYPQALSVGLYGGKQTFLEKVDQPMDPAWCGGSSDNPAPATPWCSRVDGIKGMTLSAILLHGLATIAFLFFLGKSPKSIRGIYVATSVFAAVAVALSIWLWLDVKEGFCQSVLPGFRVIGGPFRCDLGTGFNYMVVSGPLFLLAAVAGGLATRYLDPATAAVAHEPATDANKPSASKTNETNGSAAAAAAAAVQSNGANADEEEGPESPV